MHRTKHGSDSGVYDTEGRFIPQRFEDMFSKFDVSGKGGLDFDDIQDMVYANMDVRLRHRFGSTVRLLICSRGSVSQVNDVVGWIAGAGAGRCIEPRGCLQLTRSACIHRPPGVVGAVAHGCRQQGHRVKGEGQSLAFDTGRKL